MKQFVEDNQRFFSAPLDGRAGRHRIHARDLDVN
jgi:hypothetical protein